ncbi:hypothetical protein [Sphingomonas sp.]|uniref:spike base protein, RCAP_Rcc01079 family n=1 Tax=Sphingomonas sp. TaxID=28214 RepID=UPI0028B11668|nr:hypothetical protein [Sphingomonas sp.]
MSKAATADMQAQMLTALQALAPATDAVPITASDTVDLDQEASAIACGGNAGMVKLRTAAGKDRTIAIATGQTIAVRFKRVFLTGTSATGLSALLSALAPTGLPTPTPAPQPAPQPSLSLSSAVTKAEGDSGTTAFTWTLSLNRDGATTAFPFAWSVTGSGTNPADAADFGGTLPSGSGTFAAGETSKTITVLVSGDTAVEPAEGFTLTVYGTGLNTVTSMGTISNDDLPALSLTPTSASIPSGAAAGYQVAAISNVPAGATPTLTPNDGRFAIGGSAGTGWVVVVGASALSAGSVSLTISAAGAAATNLPVTIKAPSQGVVSPAAAYTGDAGSGFAGSTPIKLGIQGILQPWLSHMGATSGTTGGLPAPAAHPLWTDKLWPDGPLEPNGEIGVIVESLNDNASVTFHVEGGEVVLGPEDRRIVEIPMPFGKVARVVAYVVKVNVANGGAIDWYATVTTPDAGSSPRIIGPMRQYIRTAPDRIVSVDPARSDSFGVSYTTVQKAMNYASGNLTDKWIQIKAVAPIELDPGSGAMSAGNSVSNARRGVVEVNGKANLITIRSPSAKVDFRPSQNGLVFNGAKFDMTNIASVYSEDPAGNASSYRPLVVVNSEITGGGQYEVFQNGNTRKSSFTRIGTMVIGSYIHDLETATWSCVYRIGNYIKNVANDILNIPGYANTAWGGGVVAAYNYARNCNSDVFRAGTDAFSFNYGGAGTATLRISGATGTVNKKVEAILGTGTDATVVGTFSASTTLGSGNYWVQDFVNAANAALGGSGWTFAVVDNGRAFATVGPESATQTYPNGSTIKTYAWQHVDLIQLMPTAHHDNLICVRNVFVLCDGQVFTAPSLGYGTTNSFVRDCFGWQSKNPSETFQWQIQGTWRNSAIENNTFPSYVLYPRWAAVGGDADFRIRNNIAAGFREDGTKTAYPTMSNNHGYQGGTITGQLYATSGGSFEGDFPNVYAPSFTAADLIPSPTAAIRAVSVPTISKFDVFSNVRGSQDIPGGVSRLAAA